MPTKVVDASAIAAVLFVEPEGRDVLERVRGSELAAPTLLSYELANVCRTKIRRHPGSHTEFAESLRDYSRLRIAEHAVRVDEAVDLAVRLGITAYDAAYAWLARSLGVELVTLDRELDRAYHSIAR